MPPHRQQMLRPRIRLGELGGPELCPRRGQCIDRAGPSVVAAGVAALAAAGQETALGGQVAASMAWEDCSMELEE